MLSNSAKYCKCLSERPMTTLDGALHFTIVTHVCTHFKFAELEHPLQPLCTHQRRLATLQVQLAPVLLKSLSRWLCLFCRRCWAVVVSNAGLACFSIYPSCCTGPAVLCRIWSIWPQIGGENSQCHLVTCYCGVCSLKGNVFWKIGQNDPALINVQTHL